MCAFAAHGIFRVSSLGYYRTELPYIAKRIFYAVPIYIVAQGKGKVKSKFVLRKQGERNTSDSFG